MQILSANNSRHVTNVVNFSTNHRSESVRRCHRWEYTVLKEPKIAPIWLFNTFLRPTLIQKQVQLERLRSENTPALSLMNKFKNIIQITPWLILETTIEHFDKWTYKSQKPK